MNKILFDVNFNNELVENMVFSFLEALKRVAPSYKLTTLSDKTPKNSTIKTTVIPFYNSYGKNLIVPLIATINKEQPFCFLNSEMPTMMPFSTPIITWLNNIQSDKIDNDKKYKRQLQNTIYKSDLLLVPTDTLKKELTEKFNLSKEPVSIGLASAIENKYLELPLAINNEKYFYVNTNNINKDALNDLLKIFIYSHTTGQNKPKLYLIGKINAKSHELSINLEVATKVGAIREYDNILPEQRASFLRGAIAALLPSKIETLPIYHLDAMKCSCPVVTIENESIKEICQDAVIYANMNDTDTYLEILNKLEFDSNYRTEFINKGLYRESLFSWDNTARLFIKNIEALNDE